MNQDFKGSVGPHRISIPINVENGFATLPDLQPGAIVPGVMETDGLPVQIYLRVTGPREDLPDQVRWPIEQVHPTALGFRTAAELAHEREALAVRQAKNPAPWRFPPGRIRMLKEL